MQSHAKDFCLILQSGPNSNKVSSWFLKLHIEEIKTTIIKDLVWKRVLAIAHGFHIEEINPRKHIAGV